MQLLIIVSCLLLSAATSAKPSCCKCLPKEIQPTDVVSYQNNKPYVKQGKHAITVAEKLASLKARCKKGKLIDGSGRQIYFFQLAGCWGNPPDNYQEILEKQEKELIKLRQRYTVIEMTCNPSGEPIP